MKTVDECLAIIEKGEYNRDQLFIKLHSYLIIQKLNGKGGLTVTNKEMINLIEKYL